MPICTFLLLLFCILNLRHSELTMWLPLRFRFSLQLGVLNSALWCSKMSACVCVCVFKATEFVILANRIWLQLLLLHKSTACQNENSCRLISRDSFAVDKNESETQSYLPLQSKHTHTYTQNSVFMLTEKDSLKSLLWPKVTIQINDLLLWPSCFSFLWTT